MTSKGINPPGLFSPFLPALPWGQPQAQNWEEVPVAGTYQWANIPSIMDWELEKGVFWAESVGKTNSSTILFMNLH